MIMNRWLHQLLPELIPLHLHRCIVTFWIMKLGCLTKLLPWLFFFEFFVNLSSKHVSRQPSHGRGSARDHGGYRGHERDQSNGQNSSPTFNPSQRTCQVCLIQCHTAINCYHQPKFLTHFQSQSTYLSSLLDIGLHCYQLLPPLQS